MSPVKNNMRGYREIMTNRIGNITTTIFNGVSLTYNISINRLPVNHLSRQTDRQTDRQSLSAFNNFTSYENRKKSRA